MMVLLLVAVLFTSAVGAEVIRVVPLEVSDNTTFSCGERCKFRGALPNEPLRLRIIRGTVSELAAVTNDPRYTAAGCIELYSTVVRPRRSRRAADLLDLKFYFHTGWLRSNGSNGEFVFIVERDDNPNGPQIERTSMLRLPAGLEGARYFSAGVDVAILAPVRVANTGGGGLLARWFGFARLAASRTPAARAAADEPATLAEPEVADATFLTAAMPHVTAAANCVDLQIDSQPVLIRRADAPPRKGPVHVAVK